VPWEIRKKGKQHCVHKKGEDSPIAGGCHDSRADAIKHQRALYVNEETAAATKVSLVSEAEVVDLAPARKPYWQRDETLDERVKEALEAFSEVAEHEGQSVPLRALVACMEAMERRYEEAEERHRELLARLAEQEERTAQAIVTALSATTQRITNGEKVAEAMVTALETLATSPRTLRVERDADGRATAYVKE
jgi:hypothetical protein